MKKKIKEIIVNLLKLRNTPPEIALGVAIGVFIATMPVYGLHTVMVIVAAFLVRRANIIAILAGTNISLPPTVPFITWGGYEIGRLILRNHYPDLNWNFFKNLTFQRIADLYLPLFLGSIVLGFIMAVIFYYLALAVIKTIQKRRKKVCSGHKEKNSIS